MNEIVLYEAFEETLMNSKKVDTFTDMKRGILNCFVTISGFTGDIGVSID